jgi:predicted DNA-binding transcriptional regulator AlpA
MSKVSEKERARRVVQRVAALSERDAAEYLGMSESWLRQARLRQDEDAPRHFRMGRAVRYRIVDLDAHAEARLSATETGAAA